MLKLIKSTGNRGKIIFEQQYRHQFDIVRQHFKAQNKSIKYAKQYSYAMNPFSYAITPMGTFNVGQADDIITFCKTQNIICQIQDKLQKIIHPKMHIQVLEDLPNPEYQYRDYQESLINSLAKNGRGIIVSPTRSGKSLILAGLFHNTLLQMQKNEIRNILLIVPNLLLVEQFINDLQDYYTIKQQTITITLQNNKKIQLNGNDQIQTKRGIIKAKDLKKSDEILNIKF